jgi:GNAT superfamily N-acetyltransferase
VNALRTTVQPLAVESLPAIVEVLSDAFAGYPTMRYVLGHVTPSVRGDLEALMTFLATARFLRREPVLGALRGQDLVGVALVSDPDGPPSPELLSRVRETTWARLGTAARRRYEAFGAAAASVTPARPRLNLNMLAVRADHRGGGVGRALVDAVQDRARAHATAEGTSLTTEDPANVPLYRRMGFEVCGEARVSPELTIWGMFRPR